MSSLRRRSRNHQDGYLAAAIGGAIGAVALMILGQHLGIAYVKMFMPNAELEGVIPPSIGAFIGWWLGSALGCWLCLLGGRYQQAKRTAILLLVLTPLGIICWMFAYVSFLNWVSGTMTDLEVVQLQLRLRLLSIGLMVVAIPLLARFLT
ncbi:MAG: hypothetical protein KME05_12835 [Gloeocapsa sp. UFS-A4-WI-NPMV-4B04]|jgi:hypothetical protein|nr:hypothetical protein [Gloeocapsa sp. UFS-A4-WI-NPMV-4B04]